WKRLASRSRPAISLGERVMGHRGDRRREREVADSTVCGNDPTHEAFGLFQESPVLLPRQHRELLERADHVVDQAHVAAAEELHHRRIRQPAQGVLGYGVEAVAVDYPAV